MDDTTLDAIEARQKAAASARWEIIGGRDGPRALMALLGEDVPALVAEVRRLTESRSTVAANLAASLLRAEAEVRTLRAKVAEVDALPDEWEGEADANETHPKECRTLLSAASQLRAALATTGEGQ